MAHEEAGLTQPPSHNADNRGTPPWWQARWIVQVIGVTKLFKAMALVLMGIGALQLLHGDIHAKMDEWVRIARVDSDNYFVHSLLEKIFALQPATLRAIGLGTFIYSGLYGLEGVGLLFDKTWAEWLTVIISTGFIPMEIYHIAAHGFHPIGVTIFMLNVIAVLFLIGRLRGKHDQKVGQGVPAAPGAGSD